MGSSEETKTKLVVDVSDDFIDEYKKGAIKLSHENGKLVAQVRTNGKYGEKLPIKEEEISNGSLSIADSLELQAIQEALVQLSEQIQVIDANVREILTGQQNDRMGLYYSGVSLYIESANLNDSDFKKSLLVQALKTLSDAEFQLVMTVKSDIRYLKNKEFTLDKRNQFKLLNEKMKNIEESFMVIHQISMLKAAIYFKEHEFKSMVSVLQTYSGFIEGTIANNAYILAQCDVRDTGELAGIWKRRAELKLNVSNLVRALQAPKNTIFIEGEVEENEGI